MIKLALYHPQIPQNTGTLLRLCSCFQISVELIRPLGFVFDDKKLKRAGMDYIKNATYYIHESFEDFAAIYKNRRLITLDVSQNTVPYHTFNYLKDDILLVGSEHYGFLDQDRCTFNKIMQQTNNRSVKIPMAQGNRSINMAISASIVLSEALRQTNCLPK